MHVFAYRRHSSSYREELFECEFQRSSSTAPVASFSTASTTSVSSPTTASPVAPEYFEPVADGEEEEALSDCELLDEWLADADTEDVPPALRALAAGPSSATSASPALAARAASHSARPVPMSIQRSDVSVSVAPIPQHQVPNAAVSSAAPTRRARKPYRGSTQPLPDYIPL